MKKITLITTLFYIALSSYAQSISGEYLDINNIKAQFNSDGNFGAVEAPGGGGKSTIYKGNLWFGGYDAGGQLKSAAQTYSGSDFFSGPIDTSGIYGPAYDSIYNRVWKINKCDIDLYFNWINNGSNGVNPLIPSNMAAMEVINTWPAFNMYGQPLAPYYDVNSDGAYHPSDGDVPLIKGDQAIFFVYNDARGIHTFTRTPPIGIEIQGMAYAYNCASDSALYNTIFSNYKISNKSSFRLDSAFIGNWTDMDLGWYADDAMGCDVTRGAYFGYNGATIDGSGQSLAYGANPPAHAIVFLQGPYVNPDGIDNPLTSTANGLNYGDGITDNERLGMSGFLSYNNSISPVNGNAGTGDDSYQYLTGTWRNGTPVTYGGNGTTGSMPCLYMFPGNSDPLGFGTNGIPSPNWDDASSGDIRGVGSYGPFTFQPGSVQSIDFAFVFAKANSGGNLASVTLMQDRIDSVRQKFNTNGIANCGCNGSTGINNLDDNKAFSIYPNPATNSITINYKSTSKKYTAKVVDSKGAIVKSFVYNSSPLNTISISDLPIGIYLLNVYDENSSTTKRFIKN